MTASVVVPGLPAPLRSINDLEEWSTGDLSLVFHAGSGTDWFRDPASTAVMDNAPALVMPVAGTWMLQARVSATHEATFDAAVLAVHVDARTWAKLCLELSPQGQVMVVSVVTRGESDDCNSVVVDGPVWLRVSRLQRAFAFHYSLDGTEWHMVRCFSLGDPTSVEVGFLAQSPTGAGCTATFTDIAFEHEELADLRSGV